MKGNNKDIKYERSNRTMVVCRMCGCFYLSYTLFLIYLLQHSNLLFIVSLQFSFTSQNFAGHIPTDALTKANAIRSNCVYERLILLLYYIGYRCHGDGTYAAPFRQIASTFVIEMTFCCFVIIGFAVKSRLHFSHGRTIIFTLFSVQNLLDVAISKNGR